MSRSDHTTPWRVVDVRGDCRTGECHGYPCKHTSVTARLAVSVRKAARRSRTRLRADLAHGREPSTDQHRHSARWDAW